MINIFNRREVCCTFDIKKQADVREKLSANGIDYIVRVYNSDSANKFGRSRRARYGSFGTDTDYVYQYRIYVHKRDYNKAKKSSL